MLRATFLPGDAEEWAEARRRELAALRRRLLTVAADAARSPGEALVLLDEAISLDELSEELHRRVIRAHLDAGDRPAALRAYERCRAVLEEELGVSPSPETEAALVLSPGAELGLPL